MGNQYEIAAQLYYATWAPNGGRLWRRVGLELHRHQLSNRSPSMTVERDSIRRFLFLWVVSRASGLRRDHQRDRLFDG